MINNSTNINKTNYHISSQLTEHRKKRPGQETLEIQVLDWDMYQIMGLGRL